MCVQRRQFKLQYSPLAYTAVAQSSVRPFSAALLLLIPSTPTNTEHTQRYLTLIISFHPCSITHHTRQKHKYSLELLVMGI